VCGLPRWGLTTALRPRPWAHRGAVKTAVLGSFLSLDIQIGTSFWRAAMTNVLDMNETLTSHSQSLSI